MNISEKVKSLCLLGDQVQIIEEAKKSGFLTDFSGREGCLSRLLQQDS